MTPEEMDAAAKRLTALLSKEFAPDTPLGDSHMFALILIPREPHEGVRVASMSANAPPVLVAETMIEWLRRHDFEIETKPPKRH